MRYTERPLNGLHREPFTSAWYALSVWDFVVLSTSSSPVSVAVEPVWPHGPEDMSVMDMLFIVELRGWRSWFSWTRKSLAHRVSVWLRIHRMALGVRPTVVVYRAGTI
jgi:hypothetical protein